MLTINRKHRQRRRTGPIAMTEAAMLDWLRNPESEALLRAANADDLLRDAIATAGARIGADATALVIADQDGLRSDPIVTAYELAWQLALYNEGRTAALSQQMGLAAEHVRVIEVCPWIREYGERWKEQLVERETPVAVPNPWSLIALARVLVLDIDRFMPEDFLVEAHLLVELYRHRPTVQRYGWSHILWRQLVQHAGIALAIRICDIADTYTRRQARSLL
jgi:hypothetical protein